MRKLIRIATVLALVTVSVFVARPAVAAAPGTAYVVGTTLYFVAGDNTDNVVTFYELAGEWHAFDLVAAITPGQGCGQGGNVNDVVCPGITAIFADGLDGDDILGVRETAMPTARFVAAARLAPARSVDASLRGGTGDDSLTGGLGDDVLDGGPGADRMSGFHGMDTVTYSSSTGRVTADPDDVIGDDGTAGEGDTIYSDVENLIGGSGADHLRGSAGANYLIGGPGADALFGLGGDDVLDGGPGADLLDGGADNDTCRVGSGGAHTFGCETVV